MNYSLFYKMIKEGGGGAKSPQVAHGPAPTPAQAPTSTPAPAPAPASQPSSDTAPKSPTTPYTLTQSAAQNLNSTYPQSVDQLVDGWIQQKEQYYRGRAEKYPQYANYTVSPEAQRGMRRQAEEIFKKYKTPEAREAYFQQHPEMLGHNGASNYASIANSRHIAKVNAPVREARRQAEQAQRAQQAPMQNPTADAAIGNPPITPLSTASSYEPDPKNTVYAANPATNLMESIQDAKKFFNQYGYNPSPTSVAYSDFVNRYMGNVLKGLYPNLPPSQAFYAWMNELRQSNDPAAQQILGFMNSADLNYLYQGNIPSRFGTQTPVAPSSSGSYFTNIFE